MLDRLKGERNVPIKPDEWRSGQTPVLMDLIFPWVGHEDGLKELKGLMPGLVEILTSQINTPNPWYASSQK